MENRLEEIRKARGIKQEDLALELGVSRQTISSLEKGRYNPSMSAKCPITKSVSWDPPTLASAFLTSP